MAAVLGRGVEELLREILRVHAVPYVGVIRSCDIDTAAGSHRIGQCAALDHVIEVLLAVGGGGIEHIFPGPEPGDRHVERSYGLPAGADTVRVVDGGIGAIGRAVANTPVLPRQVGWVVGPEKDRTSQPDSGSSSAVKWNRREAACEQGSSGHEVKI